jgi:hypothetical protein
MSLDIDEEIIQRNIDLEVTGTIPCMIGHKAHNPRVP